MTRATSLFLDVLRLSAALVVFLAHTTHYWNPALMGVMQVWAHDAVIVFFVLSGYVIAHSTMAEPRSARDYALARLSRLYSVVIPALVLTGLLWVAGRELDPELYAQYERAYPWPRFLVSGFFLNEVWMLELSPPTNTPFWSLGYEAWYYVLFGLGLFVTSWRKWLCLGIGLVLAGPNIAMLLPVWLVGVAAYRWRERGNVSKSVGAAGFLVVGGLLLWAQARLPDWPETPGQHPWYFAGAAVSDLLMGVGWGALIWFFNRAVPELNIHGGFYRVVRWSASHTFSLYLFHAPLVIFATALAPPSMVRGYEWVPCWSILFIVLVLGAISERTRKLWKDGLSWAWSFAETKVRSVMGQSPG